MIAQGIADDRDRGTYRRWLESWISYNHDIWTFIREGAKAWNDKCAYAITRDINLLNVGDVIVADGHKLDFEIVNPWTGKACRMILVLWYDMKSSYPLGWEIMPTEDTAAINAALRRAILTLGKIPQVAYLDNGKAFKSKFFAETTDFAQVGISGLYERLGIKTIFAWPYHGQSKTIERFFRDMGELERLAPTYVGNKIENKPPRMQRGERLHRKLWDAAMPEHKAVTLEAAHQAIAAWFDENASRVHEGGHLKGQRSIDVFNEGKGPGIDESILRELMMAVTIKTPRRCEISLNSIPYYAPELAGLTRPLVVRYDLQDRRGVHAYDAETGEFLCTAIAQGMTHPAAYALGNSTDQEELKRQIALKHHHKKEVENVAKKALAEHVMPEVRQRVLDAGFALIEAEQAEAGLLPRQTEEELNAEVAERIAAIDPVAEFLEGIDDLPDKAKYEKILEGRAKGLELPESMDVFAACYELLQRQIAESSKGFFDEDRRVAAG